MPEIVFISPETGTGPRSKSGRARILKPYLPLTRDVRPEAELNVVYFPWICVARACGFLHNAQDQIEPSSVRLGGVSPTHYVLQDYNGDGIPDLQAYFDTAEMKLSSETKRIALTARTRAGPPVGGTDALVLFPSSEFVGPAQPAAPASLGRPHISALRSRRF